MTPDPYHASMVLKSFMYIIYMGKESIGRDTKYNNHPVRFFSKNGKRKRAIHSLQFTNHKLHHCSLSTTLLSPGQHTCLFQRMLFYSQPIQSWVSRHVQLKRSHLRVKERERKTCIHIPIHREGKN